MNNLDNNCCENICKAFEDTRNEGAYNKAIIIAENFLEEKQLSLEVIARVTELPLKKIKELAGA